MVNHNSRKVKRENALWKKTIQKKPRNNFDGLLFLLDPLKISFQYGLSIEGDAVS